MTLRLPVVCFAITSLATCAVSPLDPFVTYTNGEVLLAGAVVTEPPFNADPQGRGDATPAFQAALDTVSDAGGGVVYAPAGHYHMDGRLIGRTNTTLVGDWVPSADADISAATVLMIHADPGTTDAPAFLNLHATESHVRNLVFWYPEQDPSDPFPYPWTVEAHVAQVRWVTFVNAYRAIDLRTASGSFVSDVTGTVLEQGLHAWGSSEFAWLTNVHFSPDTWLRFGPVLDPGFPVAKAAASVSAFTRANLTGFRFGRLDGYAVYDISADQARTPIRVEKTPEEAAHQVFGLGGILARAPAERLETGWDPWYYGMHYADLDAVPEATGRTYEFAHTPTPARTDPESVVVATQAPFLVKADGRTDSTVALQGALDTVAEAGGGTVYLPPGQYRIEGRIVVPRGVELRGPLGVGKARNFRETCSLLTTRGHATDDPDQAPAFLTVLENAGVRGLCVVHPRQGFPPEPITPYPYAVRLEGADSYLYDVMLLNAYNGVDIRGTADRHRVVGLWGTVFQHGLTIGGGCSDGVLERTAFSYGVWSETQRTVARRKEHGMDALGAWYREHVDFYRFGSCERQRTFGIVGFAPRVHLHLVADGGSGCRNAELWLTMFDVSRMQNLVCDKGGPVDLYGYFGTGGGDRQHNWVEVNAGFDGPLRVFAPTIQPIFLNRPLPFDRLEWYREQGMVPDAVTCSRQEADDDAATAVADRSLATSWTAEDGDWIQLDLGQRQTLGRWRAYYGHLTTPQPPTNGALVLETSEDGVRFEVADKAPLDTFAWVDRPLDAVTARYARLSVTLEPVAGNAPTTLQVHGFDVFSRP